MIKNLINYIAVAVILGFATGCTHQEDAGKRALIPLRKGNYWKYVGIYNGQPVTLTTKVRETITRGKLVYATLRGFPSDILAGQDWEVTNWGLLSVSGEHYYKVEGHRVDSVRKGILDERNVCQGLVHDDEIFLEAMKDTGQTYGPAFQISRLDGNYYWKVRSKEAFEPSAIAGVTEKGPFDKYTLSFWTVGDDVTIELVPGIGIVRYLFHHHATHDQLDMKLVATGTE
jgi:hypothetical protein